MKANMSLMRSCILVLQCTTKEFCLSIGWLMFSNKKQNEINLLNTGQAHESWRLEMFNSDNCCLDANNYLQPFNLN